MNRRRYHDPLGVLECPNVVTDPDRAAEIQAETMRKVRYLNRHYRAAKALGLDRESFNKDVDRLRKFARHPDASNVPTKQLNMWLALAVNDEARKLAGLPADAFLGPPSKDILVHACINVAKRVKKLRGTPGQVSVRDYVEGAMAIILEATGRPVISHKELDYTYDPKVSGENGETLRLLVDEIEPGISDTKLAYWVREIRKKFAGKAMRFEELFPGYRFTMNGEIAVPRLRGRYKVTAFTPVSPIYCP